MQASDPPCLINSPVACLLVKPLHSLAVVHSLACQSTPPHFKWKKGK